MKNFYYCPDPGKTGHYIYSKIIYVSFGLSQFELTWVSLGLILARFGQFWVSLVCFGSFWVSLGFLLGRFDPLQVLQVFWYVLTRFRLFWVTFKKVLTCFGSFWVSFWFVLTCFWSCCLVLSQFRSPSGPFWVILGHLGSFWVNLGKFRSSFGQF